MNIKLTLELAALHLDEFTVADEFNIVLFKILVNIWVFHKLIFPHSIKPSAGYTLKLVRFNRRVNEGFCNTIFRNICPDFKDCVKIKEQAYADYEERK